MSDESLAERMARYEAAAEAAATASEDRDDLARAIGESLAGDVETAVAEAGATVETVHRTADGHGFTFEARLDRAALVAALTEELPGGFVVSHVNVDGSLSIEWTGRDRTARKRDHGAVLKAIIAEETESDADGLITAVPTHERVLDRAAELGVDRADAAERLERLATLEVIDIADGKVYPETNFSRF